MAKLQRQLEERRKNHRNQKDVAERARCLSSDCDCNGSSCGIIFIIILEARIFSEGQRIEMRAVSEELLRAKAELKSLEKQRSVSTLKADNMS